MNQSQIDFIKSLDKDQQHGTIQGVLMGDNLSVAPFESVAKYLLKMLSDERYALMEENVKMRKVLVDNGLYGNFIIGKE